MNQNNQPIEVKARNVARESVYIFIGGFILSGLVYFLCAVTA